MGGYQVGSTRELKVNTAATITALGSDGRERRTDLAAEIGTLPAPAAGTSIAAGAEHGADGVERGHAEGRHGAAPARRLGQDSATMIEQVEVDVRGPFARFAE